MDKMKRNTLMVWLTIAVTVFLANTNALAQARPKMAGIGFRGSFWNMNDNATLVSITDNYRHRVVSTGGAGGWVNFFSRTSDNWFLEFSLGAVAKTVDEVLHPDGVDTRVNVVVPVLLGMRFHLFSPTNRGALRPYLSFGGGPYWIADIFSKERYYAEEVIIKSELKTGGYAGVGMDFMLADWFGLNFDVRRHFVNFNTNSDYSGNEYALGIQFMWGNYRPSRGR
jgi:outer membrane protein W